MALELSYVNCSLQLLKEELEELNCSVDAEGPGRCVHVWRRRVTQGGACVACVGVHGSVSGRGVSCVAGTVGVHCVSSRGSRVQPQSPQPMLLVPGQEPLPP